MVQGIGITRSTLEDMVIDPGEFTIDVLASAKQSKDYRG
jgi:hypothetical protein